MKNKKKYNCFRKGMTLVELIIAIGIFSLTILGMVLFFARLWSDQGFILAIGTSSVSSYQGVSRMVNDVRNARMADNGDYMIESVGDFSFVFYTDIDRDDVTEKVCFSLLVDGDLERRVVDPNPGVPVTYDDCSDPGADIAIIARDVINTGSEPIFYYYDIHNNFLTDPISLGEVRMVRVVLIIETNSKINNGEVLVESFAAIRNLKEE